MTKLSVNVNKIATIRNARGGKLPNVSQVAIDCEKFGAQGITVHPRPDERHITSQDVIDLKKVVTIEYNIEGYPNERFMEMVLDLKPTQATLVPDPPGVLTSNAGWDTVKNESLLNEICQELNNNGIRTSIFIDANPINLEGAKKVGTDRIEFYTGPYADMFEADKEDAIKDYRTAAILCNEIGLGINAGHDLSLKNLAFFKKEVPNLLEGSIGHALWSDALYLGMENTINMYLRELR
jgi:pyridoxine 5-phosphate synthase